MNWVLHLLLFITVVHLSVEDCLSRDYGNGGTVCVCNANHCDTFDSINLPVSSKFLQVTSNKAGLRFHTTEGSIVPPNNKLTANNIIEIGTETYQEIIGFGGAFTDATGINIRYLDEEAQDKLIRAYFANDGLEYSIGRVPIGGTDFSLNGYSYCESDENDPELKHFNITEEDHLYKIPYIQKALELRNNTLDLFASAWIAPNWMKTVPGWFAKLSFIKDEYYQTWADYFVKFLDAYEDENIKFWGITTGNEPLTSIMPKDIPSIAWTPKGMKKWIKENLGPSLRSSKHSNIKLITLDDQRILLPWIADFLFTDETVKKYVDGIGVHWYTDLLVNPEVLDTTNKQFPNKIILATEGCNGFLFFHVMLGNWDRGETYANNIIQDLNHWVTGWTDWNMALDIQGGPTFIDNFVDSPIIVNGFAGEFYKQPMYYVMGHFSKFIPKGSLRLRSSTFNERVPVAAFKRPDDGISVIILNKEEQDIPVTIKDSDKGSISLTLSPKSITSIVYN